MKNLMVKGQISDAADKQCSHLRQLKLCQTYQSDLEQSDPGAVVAGIYGLAGGIKFGIINFHVVWTELLSIENLFE